MTMKNHAPDEIEQQVIVEVSAVLQHEALWTENRSYFTRLMEKGISGSGRSGQKRINEEALTKAIVAQLSELGRRLGFMSDNRTRDWMYDILWREQNTAGEWWLTNSVPLVLSCNWSRSEHGFVPLETLDQLMVARADHRVLVCLNRYSGNVFDDASAYVRQTPFAKKGDRYLFLCYVPELRTFHSRVHVVE